MVRFADFGGLRLPQESIIDKQIETFFLAGWPGGWRPDLEESLVDSKMIPELLNMNWIDGYGLEKRSGFTIKTDAVSGMTTGEYLWGLKTTAVINSTTLKEPSQLMLYATEADATIFYQTSAKLLHSSNTDFVDSTKAMGQVKGTASNRNPIDEFQMSAFIFNDVAYVTGHRFGGDDNGSFTNATQDGTSTGPTIPLKYVITTDTWSRDTVPPLHTSGTQTGIPRAIAVIVSYDRVFYANVASQNLYDYGSRVYFSDAGTADKITGGDAGSFLTVGGDDGTTIRAMVFYGDSILVFKEESIWLLTGTDEDTFAVQILTDEYGCHSSHTISIHNGVLMFLDPYAGVISYNGARFDNLSRDINDDIFGNINDSATFKAVGFVDSSEEKYYLSIPIGDAASTPSDRPTRTYVYDFALKTWTVWDYGFTSIVKIDATVDATAPVAAGGPLWTVGNDNTAGAFEINSGLTDNAVQFSAKMRTAFFNPGDVGDRHRLRQLNILAGSASPGGTVTQSFNYDFEIGSPLYTDSYNVNVATNEEWHQMDYEQKATRGGLSLESIMWTWLSIELSQASSTDIFSVNGMGIAFTTRKNKRAIRPELNK